VSFYAVLFYRLPEVATPVSAPQPTKTSRELREVMPTVTDSYPPATITLPARDPLPIVVDFRVIAKTIRHRGLAVAIGALAGVAVGTAILLFVPARFDSHAMLLIRTTSMDPTAAVRSRMGAVAELLPGALGGSSDEELSTELALL